MTPYRCKHWLRFSRPPRRAILLTASIVFGAFGYAPPIAQGAGGDPDFGVLLEDLPDRRRSSHGIPKAGGAVS